MAASVSPIGSSCDPLLYRAPLPIERTLYPLGFPLLLRTNSKEAETAALESWADFQPSSKIRPIELRILVTDGGLAPAAAPAMRGQGTLLTFAADRDNFGAVDLERDFASLSVSRAAVARRDTFRWFFLDAVVCTMLAYRAVTPLHAACVARNGAGVLLCGPSGAGKSTLALACALDGWSLISEDASYAVDEGDPGWVRGRPCVIRLRPDAPAFFPALAAAQPAPHPNGKPTIEVAAAAFPAIHTASGAEIRALVALRRGARRPVLRRTDPGPVIEELLGAIPWFGEEPRARHERSIHALARRGTWEIGFHAPQQAVALLRRITENP